MDDIGGAVGTGIEGGLYAKAIGGGRHGAVPLDDGHFAEEGCLNCSAHLLGPHCHECGQEAHLHRTVGALVHDILHGALHFEGKTWHTLPALILRPGDLTRRYVAGERRRFVSPMGIFLFSIFLMFAVFQAIGLTAPSEVSWGPEMADEVVSVREETAERQAEYQRAMDSAAPGSEAHTAARSRRDELARELAQLDRANRALSGIEDLEGAAGIAVSDGGFWSKAVAKWRKNPGLMLYKLQSNGYKFSWMLIPISVPFMWVLFFWKRRFGLYDHAVFVTYSIAFMSLLFVVLSLLVELGVPEGVWGLLLLLVPPLHIYRQLRGAYGLNRFSALWRLGLLVIFIGLTTALFAQFLFLVGSV